ncbi:UNVERIFIED_CONTAM: hypothetical protein RF653_16915 [Kocuria sp. CPCC 205316]|uniref:hypothetical protein n=1 Tax=Kocuria sp. CPCC 205316 TaxID=3073559 RepID=UPI0036D85838
MLSSPLDRQPPASDLLNSKLQSQLHAMKYKYDFAPTFGKRHSSPMVRVLALLTR